MIKQVRKARTNILALSLIALSIFAGPIILASSGDINSARLQKAREIVSAKFQYNHAPNRYIVKFTEGVEEDTKENALRSATNLRNSFRYRKVGADDKNIMVIKTENESQAVEEMSQLLLNPKVEWVEPDYRAQASWDTTSVPGSAYPDDWDGTNHWYYDRINLPQTYGELGCGTISDEACGGSSEVVVAVLDTGVAFESYSANFDLDIWDPITKTWTYNQPYTPQFEAADEINAANMIWTNPMEDTTDGTDGDHNGICDDEHGADFVQHGDNYYDWTNQADYEVKCGTSTDIQKEGHPNDDDGHGTFVTEIIAGTFDNSASNPFGIVPNVKIMPVKVLDYTGGGNFTDIFDGISYAIAHGADIINMSLESDSYSSLLEFGVWYARENGVTIVAATGNSGNSYLSYPAKFSKYYDNVIAVGASNPDDSRSSYSNYGYGLDVLAPVGDDTEAIWSETFTDSNTWCGDIGGEVVCNEISDRDFSNTNISPQFYQGTSMAAPQASAAAALILSTDPTLSYLDLKDIIRETADDVAAAGWDSETGYGVLDLLAVYEESVPKFIKQGVWLTAYGLSGDKLLEGDYNGDDKTDILLGRPLPSQQNQYRWWMILANGAGDAFIADGEWLDAYGLPGDTFLVGDYNNDGMTDILIGRPLASQSNQFRWWGMTSNGSGFDKGGMWLESYGLPGDTFIVGDYDNTGEDDVLIGRPLASQSNQFRWWMMLSNDSGDGFVEDGMWLDAYGLPGDKFLAGTYNNDTKVDILIGRPLSSQQNQLRWWVMSVNDTTDGFDKGGVWLDAYGLPGDTLLAGDYNNDGLTDLMLGRSLSRQSNQFRWWGMLSDGTQFNKDGIWVRAYGLPGDTLKKGDFNGDGKTDLTLARPLASQSNQLRWWVMTSDLETP